MDDQEPPEKTVSSTAPVMDVKPRRTIEVTDTNAAVNPTFTADNKSSGIPVPSDPITPASDDDSSGLDESVVTSSETSPEAPVDVTDYDSSMSTQPKTTDSLEVAEPPDEHPAQPNPLAIDAPPEPIQHRTPLTPIIVAGIIVVTLVGIIAFAYLKTRGNPASDTNVRTNKPSTPATPAVSSNDVNQTNQLIDEELKKTDDATDFSANDLTDATLGL